MSMGVAIFGSRPTGGPRSWSRALIGLVLAMAFGCGPSDRSLTSAFQAATNALWRGDSTLALTEADRGLTDAAKARDARWPTKFRLLKAEVLLVRRNLADASPLIDAPIADAPALQGLRARQR